MNLSVSNDSSGTRLDVFLTNNIESLNRSSIEKLINNDQVSLNGDVIKKSGHKLKAGDKIKILADINKLTTPEEIDLPILYEDENCIVIDKPEGVLTHSKGDLNNEGTVASFIAPRLTNMSGNRAGIVHRLDRATSGVIICAKNESTIKMLQKQFSTRKVKKVYTAIIETGIKPEMAIIDAPIGRSVANPKLFSIDTDGKPAQTKYTVIKNSDKYSMLKLEPKTGRTHQIRVHLRHIGFPIIGDTFYNGKPAKRLFLHATSLEITIPDGKRKVFESKLPKSFSEIMK